MVVTTVDNLVAGMADLSASYWADQLVDNLVDESVDL